MPVFETGKTTLNSVELVNVTLAFGTIVPLRNTLAVEVKPVPRIRIYELLVAAAVSSKLLYPLSVTTIDDIEGPVDAPEFTNLTAVVTI